MTMRRTTAVLLLATTAAFAGGARAQSVQASCSVANVPALDFGEVAVNPTVQADGTASVVVTCTGAASLANTPVRVCLLATSSGQRQMHLGGSALRYGLFGDSARTQPLTNGVPYPSTLVTLGSGASASGQAVFTLYGRIPPGQSGLPGGAYADTVGLQVRVAPGAQGGCSNQSPTTQSVLQVQTRVPTGSCTVAAGDLDFGVATHLDAAVDASATLGVTCTRGTPYTVVLGGGSVGAGAGLRRMGRDGAAGADTIAYQLYRDSARTQPWGDVAAQGVTGTGTGTPLTHNVYGRVPAQSVPRAGHYADTVTATVTY